MNLKAAKQLQEAQVKYGSLIPATTAARILGCDVKTIQRLALHVKYQDNDEVPPIRGVKLDGESRLLVSANDVLANVQYAESCVTDRAELTAQGFIKGLHNWRHRRMLRVQRESDLRKKIGTNYT
ncbi:hypothetical protein KS4_16190 [Poriferisphaera corsica]|uniref:Uncharacterized protein n=1 Tax=Poriferisphaera corsica TaxID=2528020 RepID=A0A517YTM3_9BACT|nr:hypothetical protein [Poriferisphaera corsica]QDU33568.1 hypothetical protein KS4_16190 [Poriferisphaera corsica]